MKKIILTIICGLFIQIAIGQIVINGRVLSDVTGLPISSANITLKKQKTHVMTDVKGEFSLKAINPDTLIISHIGYRQYKIYLTTGAKHKLDILLQSEQQTLKEIYVSTGYQTIAKDRATGSFTKVDQKLFNQQTTSTIIERLPNIVASINQDNRTSTPGLSIRGLSTIEGPKNPLIVIDNFPYYGNLDNLNPNDVESITILKDAAAASIWGTKAGNGVIVITTKKSKFDQSFKTEFSNSITIGSRPALSQLKLISSPDLIDIERFLFTKGHYKINSASDMLIPVTPVVEILRKQESGVLNSTDAEELINSYKQTDIKEEYNKYVYRPLLNQQYALNLSSGIEKVSWKALLGFDKNISSLSASSSRANLNLQSSIKPISNLEFSGALMITKSRTKSGNTGLGEINMSSGQFPVYTKLKDDEGNDIPIARDYSFEYINSIKNEKLLDWRYYPLQDFKHVQNTLNLTDIVADINGKYAITKDLTALISYRYQQQQSSSTHIYDANSYFARNLINNYSQIDPVTGELIYNLPYGGILDKGENGLYTNQFRSQLNFNKYWKHFALSLLAGAEISEDKTQVDNYRTYGFDPDILTSANVNYNAWYPGYATGAYSQIPNNRSISEMSNRFTSVFFNGSMSYKGRYTLSLSSRRDGSNLFGVLPNNKFNPLGSVGLSWDITKEEFLTSEFFNLIKIRSTFGMSGNTDQKRSAYSTISYLGNSPYSLSPYASIVTYANPELRWEKVKMLNLALDFSLIDNRISGSIEYYVKNAHDLFGRAIIDYTGGVGSTIIKNVGAMKGKGMDIELNSINIKGDFGWTSKFGLTWYTDRITSYYNGSFEGNKYVSKTTPLVSGVIGKPMYSIYSYKWAGLDPVNGDPQGIIEGQVSKDYNNILGSGTTLKDLHYSGSALPTVYGQFSNTLSYRSLSLTLSLNYKLGYYLRKSSLSYTALFNARDGHADYQNRWKLPGDEKRTNVPSLIYPTSTLRDEFYNNSSATIIDGDHIRLQYINLNYNFNKEHQKWLPFKYTNVYINLNNVGIIWRANRDHIDPDYPVNGILPPKNIVFGIRATF